MKILLLGKNGLLGSAFLKRLSGEADFEMYALGHADCDVTNLDAVLKAIGSIAPDIIINCTAYTAVDDAETNKEAAFAINAEGAANVAKAAKEVGAKLIHFSTDYVFNGTAEGGYEESDLIDPINVYGASKARGEEMVREICPSHYIIRTSWLFGPGGKNFVKTMLELAKVKDELGVVADQVGSPTYTTDLVEAILKYFLSPFLCKIKKHHERDFDCDYSACEEVPFGTYHLTNSDFCSWYTLATATFEISGVEIKVNPISSGEFVRPAARPAHSVLQNTKLPALRPWREALKAYLELYF